VVVPPGSSTALADGIARVMNDGALRRRIIRAGAALARESTVEVQSKMVAEAITEAVCAKQREANAARRRRTRDAVAKSW